MKQGWTYKKLGEVATFINGYPFKPTDWKNSGRKIIRIQNLNNPNATYNFYDGSIDPKYLVSNGDVLISWSGSLGVFEWSEDEAILNQHIFKVVFNKGHINKKFFEYVVASRINEMKSKVHGVTMQHITKKEFDVILIPVPPVAEQERIVAELDLLSGIIEKKKAQLKAYDQLAQSIFYTTFGDPITNEKGWETKKLGEIANCTSGGTPSRRVPRFFEGTINWFSAGELNNMYLRDSIEKITQEALDNSNAKLCPANSLFIGMYDTAAFKLGIPIKDSASNQACANVELSNDNVIWLYYSLLLMRDEALKHRHGARQKNLSLRFIKDFYVPIPPLSLQREFAEKVEAIERQKALVQQSIEETQTLFDYTMDKYFG
jgi:type I restriction enzyme S subunit